MSNMELIFQPDRIPRTMTRQEWKEAYRWLRQTRNILKKNLEEQIHLLNVYGNTMPDRMRNGIIDNIVYPPIIVFP